MHKCKFNTCKTHSTQKAMGKLPFSVTHVAKIRYNSKVAILRQSFAGVFEELAIGLRAPA